MNAQQEAVALFRFLESRGVKPSVRAVGRILRSEMGVKVTEANLRAYLRPFVASATQQDVQAVAAPTQKTSTIVAAPTQLVAEAVAPPTRLRARNKVSLVPDITTPNGVAAPARPEWATRLEQEARALRDLALERLSVEQRLVLGRYHAMRYGNCTRDEGRNRTRGAHVAASLATLCLSPQFGDFAVYEYVAKADEYHAVIGKRPWFKPWDIKAVCEADILHRSAL